MARILLQFIPDEVASGDPMMKQYIQNTLLVSLDKHQDSKVNSINRCTFCFKLFHMGTTGRRYLTEVSSIYHEFIII
jgi:hypothetical protein